MKKKGADREGCFLGQLAGTRSKASVRQGKNNEALSINDESEGLERTTHNKLIWPRLHRELTEKNCTFLTFLGQEHHELSAALALDSFIKAPIATFQSPEERKMHPPLLPCVA